MPSDITITDLVRELTDLPESWHSAGTVPPGVLSALARLGGTGRICRSAETGAGRTTVLLSHLSPDHTVFAVDGGGSLSAVRGHPLLRTERVRFVEGPTQATLPRHHFPGPLDLALIDGPHGYPFPDLEYFYLYPLLAPGALLVVDDIHIATVRHMFDFLREDAMFRLEHVEDQTAFFRRTDAPTFPPHCDGWWEQRYNSSRFPLPPFAEPARQPGGIRALIGRFLGAARPARPAAPQSAPAPEAAPQAPPPAPPSPPDEDLGGPLPRRHWSEVVREYLAPVADQSSGRPPSVALADFAQAVKSYRRMRPDLEPSRAHNRDMVGELHRSRPLAGQRLLDLGASYCGFALERALELGAVHYAGVGLEVTELEVRAPGATACLLNRNAEQLGFEEGSFDLAITLSTFEHFRDGTSVLRELARVLRPGGSALVAFEPAWTASYGHHLHDRPELARLVPPWAHLLWGPEQMRAALAQRAGPDLVEEAVRWTYFDEALNRRPLPELRAQIEGGPLAVEWLVAQPDPSPEARPELAAYLARVLPWTAEDLLTVGFSALLTRR